VAATAHETADDATEKFGDAAAPLRALAPMVTAAVYSGRDADDADVIRSWQVEAELRRRLPSGRLRVARLLRAQVDPRTLRRGWREVVRVRTTTRGIPPWR
jgi:hypothetical protein